MAQFDEIASVPTPKQSHDRAKTHCASRGRIVLIDDDEAFVESLATILADEGFNVRTFTDGPSAITSLYGGESADAILLDWRMPGMNGLEILGELRRNGISTPVLFLTALSDDIHEEAALAGGAVDFIGKSRRLSILVKRIELIAAARHPVADAAQHLPAQARLGPLELRFDINRAFWNGQEVDLSLTEFRMVSQLALKPGEDASFRELYDLVHGKDFVAGKGADGYHGNVRTFIKRIRRKFRALDPIFDHIQNYPRFGYQWVVEPDKSARGSRFRLVLGGAETMHRT